MTPEHNPAPQHSGAPDPFTFVPYDDLADGQRWSTWLDVEPLCRGPEPRPGWVVTGSGAIDTELGILKTGKEADVSLLQRADPRRPEESVVMAAKRYRSPEHRSFHRSAAYTEGRSMRRSRDQRAIKRKSTFGRQVAAGEWAVSEWNALVRCWQLGVPVPYPVQIDGTEILMEWITAEEETAPRLIQVRPAPALLASYLEQVRDALITLVRDGVAHGDLSPYNVLAAGERLVLIDMPQVVDLAGNPQGFDYLRRDCLVMSDWFTRRGLPVDGEALFADLVAQAW
ncbi:serine protein kinase RIO [Nocardioides limicola]|uniref:serine protein kinase RIO n=1 Tax=Nocardioides limicola TaxID=2803368 RepID=UPI00193B7488|nr:RIO1 family regulatory kinase/ATPase [Nocardioides sp. DJM-14]